MDLVRSIDATRLKRDKAKEAIELALAGRWQDALRVNRDVLYYFPDDVEALNRLGKALLEVGRYAEAQETFEKVRRLWPHNNIAKKNLDRLSHLQGAAVAPVPARKVRPQLFIAEGGKSGVVVLRNPATRPVLAKVAAGDPVNLLVYNHTLVVEDLNGDRLGCVEPKLGSRLGRLMTQGNRYAAAVLSAVGEAVTVIIWETYRDPSLAGVCSFPTSSRDDYRSYLRDTLLRYDIESEPEEEGDDDAPAAWGDDGDEELPSGKATAGRSTPSAEMDTEEEE